MAHVAEYKKRIIKRIVDLINAYPIVGLVNVENLPAPQLQKMRAQLRGSVDIFMTKKRLLRLAFENAKSSKQGIEKLNECFKGMPALIFAKDNPFALAKTLKKNKSTAPAKPGQTSPKAIIVQAGPTSFSPGPIIGELGSVGIKTKIDKGKIAIKEDCVVCREGEKISNALAGILIRLGIEPMEVGLDLVATYENGLIYTKDVLDIDEEEFMNNLSQAASDAFNLAVDISYPTKDTIELLLSNAFMGSKALALEANIMADAVVEELLGRAEQQMLSLKSTANIEAVEKNAEEPQEMPAEEPRKEEVPESEASNEEPKQEPPKPEEKEKEPKVEKPQPQEKPVEEKKEVSGGKEQPEEPQEEVPEAEEPQEKPAETPVEKEEQVLEEEKEILEEEKKLEEQKPAPTPAEEEVQEAVKEEEEKNLEKERIEKEKEAEKLESQSHAHKKPEPKKAEKLDTEVAKFVEQTKKKAAKEEPTAEKLVEEIKEEFREEDALKEKQEAEKKKQQEVEDLAKKLMRKGTLRK